jgi:short-subunit dehydrogenase
MNAYRNPLALVTGASSGIGFELASAFAANGYDVVVTACEPGGIESAAARLRSEHPSTEVIAVAADLADPAGVERLYVEARPNGRAVDALAANAGLGVNGDFARETALEEELRLIDLNVRGQVHLTKLVVRDMVRRGDGKVLLTSSSAGMTPGPFYACYAASKAFLRSFGQALRSELRGSGVTVTVLMPGATGAKDNPADVAAAAFRALTTHDDHVVTGTKHKLQAAMAKMLPDAIHAALHRKQTERRPG